MYQLKIINGKCHHILHEFVDKNEYVISFNNEIYYWRPNLEMIGSDYMTITDVVSMTKRLDSDKRWRSEKHKKTLINHWKEISQIMRELRIDKALQPEIDYNPYILAC